MQAAIACIGRLWLESCVFTARGTGVGFLGDQDSGLLLVNGEIGGGCLSASAAGQSFFDATSTAQELHHRLDHVT